MRGREGEKDGGRGALVDENYMYLKIAEMKSLVT